MALREGKYCDELDIVVDLLYSNRHHMLHIKLSDPFLDALFDIQK